MIDTLIIREAASKNWHSDQSAVGHIHYNTHHENYQVRLSETRWEVLPSHLIEMNNAQFDAYLYRVCEARRLARKLVKCNTLEEGKR